MFGNIVVFQCTGKLNILFGENKADVMLLWMLIIISEWYYLLFNSVHIYLVSIFIHIQLVLSGGKKHTSISCILANDFHKTRYLLMIAWGFFFLFFSFDVLYKLITLYHNNSPMHQR